MGAAAGLGRTPRLTKSREAAAKFIFYVVQNV
jgi:hypothetical protein